jgi:hypothetical protein
MSPHVIPLSPELIEEVREVTAGKETSVEAFVSMAVRERLERLWDEKLKAEALAFEKAHPKLAKRYLGKYVAMRDGKVVEVDQDFEKLFLRVQARFGNTPILIRQVTVRPEVELRGPSPRLETP